MKRTLSVMLAGLFTGLALTVASAQSQTDLNIESAKAFQKADAELNAVYKKVMAKLDDAGKKKLQEAQRAWIKFRDAECDSEADDYRGGSIMPLINNTCAKDLTERRTADLKMRLKKLEH